MSNVTELPKTAHSICKTEANWHRGERISDRYGTINVPYGTTLPAGKGRLWAKVIEPKQSSHFGDIARGLYPRLPRKNQIELLGEGKAFSQGGEGCICFGVKPNTIRQSDWLDSRALYNIHESTVEYFWEPL